MKSPRDASMVLVTLGTALTVVVAASLTSGVAFTSLTRGSADAVVEAADDRAAIPTQVGEAVPAAQADVLPQGQVAYKLDEGGQVLVEATEALPEVVVEEVKSELTKVSVTATSRDEAQTLADQVSDSTGKSVILVFQERDAVSGDQLWSHTKVKGIEPFADADQARVVSLLSTWIAAQDVPESFEIIVHQ